MAFDLKLTSYLSGATEYQLRNWSRKGILVPEVNQSNPMRYSFRDLVAARTVARLRAFTSLQRITKAVRTLEEQDLTDHLSEYRFGYDGKSIKLWNEDQLMDIDRNPGQFELYTFEDIYKPFENFRKRLVPDLLEPAPGISVNPRRRGGIPTVAGTRVTCDTVLDYADDIQTEDDLEDYFPFLKLEDVRNAKAFQQELEAFA